MTTVLTNRDLALTVLSAFEKMEMKTICICPGARNSPLVTLLLESNKFRNLFFFDERSAGFFALGRARAEGKAVAVITTSGTAAGELLPAMMEAHYSCLPLVAVSADRPARFRGTGAPQAAEQVGIYGVYTSQSLDWSKDTLDFSINYDATQGFHLNVCFDEPLIDEVLTGAVGLKFYSTKKFFDFNSQREKLKSYLGKYKNPFVIVGGLAARESESTARFLTESLFPFYAEGVSQLRENAILDPQKITVADDLISRAAAFGFPIDCILRIGDVPIHRIWRDFASKTEFPILSVSSKPFSGLPGCEIIQTDLVDFFENFNVPKYDSSRFDALKADDKEKALKLNLLFEDLPCAEPSVVHFLSEKISPNSRVYLGNSLPIREWDLAASLDHRNLLVEATRGLNGIDGQVSYFLGGLSEKVFSWAILGDLTALYDLQGPWILEQLKNSKFKILIINNGGGKIFERMFEKREFLNEHRLNFKNWAEMWNLSYQEVVDIKAAKLTARVIEVIPDSAQTAEFWRKY